MEKLPLAQVRKDGTVRYRTTIYHRGFPRWPSRHISLVWVEGFGLYGLARSRVGADTIAEKTCVPSMMAMRDGTVKTE